MLFQKSPLKQVFRNSTWTDGLSSLSRNIYQLHTIITFKFHITYNYTLPNKSGVDVCFDNKKVTITFSSKEDLDLFKQMYCD